MVNGVSLAKQLITSYYPSFEKDGGVDFDNNEKIEGNEAFVDADKDGVVGNAADYQNYLYINRSPIGKQIQLIDAKKNFLPSNMIHQIMDIQAEYHSPEEVALAYAILDRIVERARLEIKDDLPPREKVKLVYQILSDEGFILKPQGKAASLADNLLRGEIDCDTSSMIVLAVAQEKNWPIKLAHLPDHIFVRWEGKDCQFNVDYGVILKDKIYLNKYEWDGKAMDDKGIVAITNFQVGNMFLFDENFEMAIAFYQKALRDMPKLYEAQINLGLAQQYQEDFKTAQKTFVRLGKSNPKEAAKRLCSLGDIYFEKKDYVGAEKAYYLAAKFNPHDGKVFYSLGKVCLAQGREEDAVKCFELTTRLEREDRAYSKLIQIYFAKKDYQKAILACKELAKINPKKAAATYCNLGWTFKGENNGDRAIEMFKLSLKLDPKQPGLCERIGYIYYETGEYKKAIHWFKKSIDLCAVNGTAMIGLFKAQVKLGEKEKALRVYAQLTSDYPQNIASYEQSLKPLVASLP